MSLLEAARAVVGGVARMTDDLLPDVGDLGEKLCDALLPDRFEWFGDIVSGGLNLLTGNHLAAAADLGDLIGGRGTTEPDPPTSRGPRTTHDLKDMGVGDAPGAADAPGARDRITPGALGSDGTGAPGVETARSFTALGAEEMMARLREGDVPAEIFESQAGMMMLQQRVHDIQRMNQLITQLMQALHDMQMAIVRNVRA